MLILPLFILRQQGALPFVENLKGDARMIREVKWYARTAAGEARDRKNQDLSTTQIAKGRTAIELAPD
jgi:hypothetical protein